MFVQVKLVGHSCSGMQLLILEKMKQVEVLLLKHQSCGSGTEG